MQNDLITHALNLILDDGRIGEWTIAEVHKRLGRGSPQDRGYWQTYTVVTSELIAAALKENQKATGS